MKLLVWDIDGTLIHGRGVGKKSMNRAFEELFDIKGALDGINMAGAVDAVIIEQVFRQNNICLSETSRFISRYCEILRTELEMLPGSIEAPGVRALLNRLSTDAFANILGTGNIEKGARIKLSRCNLNTYFPTGGFGEYAMERWELIASAVANAKKYYRVDFSPENTYVIGDTPLDIEGGKKLGLKTVGVATGLYGPEQLRCAGADYILKDFTHESIQIF